MSVALVSAQQIGLLAALLDHNNPPWRADELPPLAHWLLFPPTARQSDIGPDGHPKRDDELFPRRMWAGSRVRFLQPIKVGSNVERETESLKITEKAGRSGPMRFETLRHYLRVDGKLAIEEEQEIVYRETAPAGVSQMTPAPEKPATIPLVTQTICADPVALFRYSALTFNAHRIHYDRDYATLQEGYPALVVHGPFIATLLMDHFLRHDPQASVTGFSFRAIRPIFDIDPFTLGLTRTATGAELIAIDSAGGLAMQARVEVSAPPAV